MQVMYASVMVELDPAKTTHTIESVLCSNLSPSRYLNKIIIDTLIEHRLIKYEDSSRATAVLMIENSDENLRVLLKIITSRQKAELLQAESLRWIRYTLIAECVRQMCYLTDRKKISVFSDIKPPEILERLISVRSVNEIKMLCWQAVETIGSRDFRLMNIGSNESVLSSLFNDVYSYHNNYFRTGRKVPTFTNPKGHINSSISKIVSQYLLGVSIIDFEMAAVSELTKFSHATSEEKMKA